MNKLINRNTGEIVVYGEGIVDLKSFGCNNVAEFLEAGWEDYKEPSDKIENIWTGNRREKTIHIKCNSEKYAKEVLLKLKAWERLKDTITCIDRASVDDVGTVTLFIRYEGKDHKKVQADLDLLFGGEDEN